MEKVRLGNTSIEVTKVGFGVLTIGSTQLDLPLLEGAGLIRYALERGINFFDTAQYYRTYPYIHEALSHTNFEPIICSKSLDSSYEKMVFAIEEARKALDRDVIDIFLLHEVRSISDFEERKGAFAALNDMKAKGKIKHIGLSTHHVDVADFVCKVPECEILFPLINFAGLGIRNGEGYGSAKDMAKAINNACISGKGIFAMKAFGGGNLVRDYRKALDYVYSLSGINSVMLGFGNKKEIDDIFDYLEDRQAPDYIPDISHKKIHIDQGDCEGCMACIKRCPNKALYINKNGLADVDYDSCLTCGYCAPVCPVRAIIMIDKP